jgi:hypothetical protein
MTAANTARQFELTAKQDFVFGDDSVEVKVPYGAIVTGGFLCVTTAFDSATSAAGVLGDAGAANRYLTSTDLKSAGVTALTVTGYKSDGANLTFDITTVGATTAGAGFVVVKYIIDGRCNEVQTH